MELSFLSVRWVQPSQQHGRRLPSLSSGTTRAICSLRVFSCLTNSTQQIHSLRASGVRLSHFLSASASAASALFRSAGNVWAVPPEISCLVIPLLSSYEPVWLGRKCDVRPRVDLLFGKVVILLIGGFNAAVHCFIPIITKLLGQLLQPFLRMRFHFYKGRDPRPGVDRYLAAIIFPSFSTGFLV